jgi:hypothetical protein
LEFQPINELPKEEENLIVTSDGVVRVPRFASRVARYQLARFSVWEGREGDFYRYRITSASLETAHQQGLRVSHLLALLRRHATNLSPILVKALERWEDHGEETFFERVVILCVKNPEILQAIRGSRAGRFLGDILGPTTITVHSTAQEEVMKVLVELGFLAGSRFES